MVDELFGLLSREYGGLLAALSLALLALGGLRLTQTRWGKCGFGLLAVVAVALCLGALSHMIRFSLRAEHYPPPGQLVDIGGYRVHVLAEGPRDDVTIVWLAGGHVGGLPMFEFHRALRGNVRSVLLDRPGTGWSDPGPFPRTTAREAVEVMQALKNAGEEGPFIFAGHSFGGLLAANIARRYPGDTASVVMLDATPLDVVFYGLDRDGLRGIQRMGIRNGLRRAFGLYGPLSSTAPPMLGQEGLVEIEDPRALREIISATPRFGFAASSIFAELTPAGLIDRAFDTMVYDGELGSLPVFLVAPGEDPTTRPYAESVAETPEQAERFLAFLKNSRERYMAMSSSSRRIYAPAGTGHVFPDQEPEWLINTMREIVAESKSDWRYRQLTTEWPGPYGGVPPVNLATPQAVADVYRRAIEEKRREVAAIAANDAPPSFHNTVLALEESGMALHRIEALLTIFTSTTNDADYAAVEDKIASLAAALEDEIFHNSELFKRIEGVYQRLSELALDAQDARLVELTRSEFLRRGALLNNEDKARLKEINSRLAELRRLFQQNSVADEANLVVFVDQVGELAGLPADRVTAARAAAESRGRPESWAIAVNRPSVWPVLTHADSRQLRERVWRQWASRGGNPGEHDNRPVANEILALRGEKAVLLGYPSFAHFQTAARMVDDPAKAMDMLLDTWESLEAVTRTETAELFALAAVDGVEQLEPWDRRYYAEKLRARNFDFDSQGLMSYLSLENVVTAMTWAAGEVLGLGFEQVDGIPLVSPDIRVFKVTRDGADVGVIYMDLFAREGKQPASWASVYRSHEDFRGRQLPLVALHSAVQKPTDGGPLLLPWERANVIFHEFGHALHTLSYRGRYPSLNSLDVPWDFIEVPSLLNERWLGDRGLLKRFMTHHETGAPMPDELMDRLERVNRDSRVFSLSFNYLATAIVDMRLHLLADGREIDAVDVEEQVLRDLKLPHSIDLTLYVPHAFHTFSEQYAAGVYTYLWSDMIAADAAEAFLEAPGGLYDGEVAASWRQHILDAGNTVPLSEAYRTFRASDPDPSALLRRFDLYE